MASTNLGYCVFILQIKKLQTYLSGLPQNHIFWDLTFINPAADLRTVVQIFLLLALAFQILSV